MGMVHGSTVHGYRVVGLPEPTLGSARDFGQKPNREPLNHEPLNHARY
ncbi:MAG: hypothetical protein Q7J98_02900 [Kiritimatiellia bacterium]|nr:hypothetical protein [Kiritimatiellia bacterium]